MKIISALDSSNIFLQPYRTSTSLCFKLCEQSNFSRELRAKNQSTITPLGVNVEYACSVGVNVEFQLFLLGLEKELLWMIPALFLTISCSKNMQLIELYKHKEFLLCDHLSLVSFFWTTLWKCTFSRKIIDFQGILCLYNF